MGLIGALKNLDEFRKTCFEPVPGPILSQKARAEHWQAVWEDADDTWPSEPEVGDNVIVTHEWGLRLPGGEVMWGNWQGVPFDNPLDRVHMIAKLQQTAQDVGWSIEEFLANYGWVTRVAYATMEYKDAEAYTLLDPAVSGTPVGPSNEGASS